MPEDLPPLIDTPDIAARLGLTRQRAHQITREKGFPEPAATLRTRKLWLLSDFEEWAEKNKRTLLPPTN